MKDFKQRLALAGIICFVLVAVGVFHVSIPVAPRFILFSLGSLLIGIIFIAGTIGGWSSFSYKR